MNFAQFFVPEILIVVLGLGLLLWEAFGSPTIARLAKASIVGLVLIGLSAVCVSTTDTYFWSGLYVWDRLGLFFKEFLIVCTILTTLITVQYESRIGAARAEFVILPLFAAAGMLLLVSVHDFILLFVALELVTVSFYILVAFQRSQPLALEAGLKYLVIGALASGFLVMGIAYLFGFTGSTQFDVVAGVIETQGASAGILFGVLLVLVGIAFKISAVPFHVWAPDVYQGAPAPITAFLAVASKAAGFAVLIRVLDQPFSEVALEPRWIAALTVLAILSLLLGNLAGLPQRNIKRLMAYSGIGHAGFILSALSSNSVAGHQAALFYLVTYLLAYYTIFLVLAIVSKGGGKETVQDFVGLSRRSPLLAWSASLAFISLAGLPPLAGFFAKFLVFYSNWQSGQYVLLVVGIVSAVAALYYYLSMVRSMFWADPIETAPIVLCNGTKIVLWVLIVLTVGLGFYMRPLLSLVGHAL